MLFIRNQFKVNFDTNQMKEKSWKEQGWSASSETVFFWLAEKKFLKFQRDRTRNDSKQKRDNVLRLDKRQSATETATEG